MDLSQNGFQFDSIPGASCGPQNGSQGVARGAGEAAETAEEGGFCPSGGPALPEGGAGECCEKDQDAAENRAAPARGA